MKQHKTSGDIYNIQILIPNSVVCDESETCVIVFNLSLPTNIDIFIKCTSSVKSTFIRAERINSTSISFIPSVNFPCGDAKLSVHTGAGQKLCDYNKPFVFKTKVDHISDLLQRSVDPMTFLASVYGINEGDSVAVDCKMNNILQAKIPEQLTFFKTPETASQVGQSSLKNPTLLHFAARYCLVELCASLLQCPGATEALQMCNCEGLTPNCLAANSGNMHLAKLLSDEQNCSNKMEIIDVSKIYQSMSADTYDRYVELTKIKAENPYEVKDEGLIDDGKDYEVMANYGKDEKQLPDEEDYIKMGNNECSSPYGQTVDNTTATLCGVNNELRTQQLANNPIFNEKLSLRDTNTLSLSRRFRPTIASHNRTLPSRHSRSFGEDDKQPQNLGLKNRQSLPCIYPINNPSVEFCRGSNEISPPELHEGNEQVLQDIYDIPPSTNNPLATSLEVDEDIYEIPTPPLSGYGTPKSVKQQTICEPEDEVPSEGAEDLYDIPPQQNLYDTPPAHPFHKHNDNCRTHTNENGEYNRNSYNLYDVPPAQSDQEGNDLYDVCPIKSNLYDVCSIKYNNAPPTHLGQDVYDIPTRNSGQNVYDIPPGNSGQGVYDVPPRNPGQDVYDIPPRNSGQDVYNVPPGISGQDVYDIPPRNSGQDVCDIPPRNSGQDVRDVPPRNSGQDVCNVPPTKSNIGLPIQSHHSLKERPEHYASDRLSYSLPASNNTTTPMTMIPPPRVPRIQDNESQLQKPDRHNKPLPPPSKEIPPKIVPRENSSRESVLRKMHPKPKPRPGKKL